MINYFQNNFKSQISTSKKELTGYFKNRKNLLFLHSGLRNNYTVI